MKMYFHVIKFNFLRYLTYPLEIFALLFRRLIGVLFLIVFWKVTLDKPYGEIINLTSYFLIAQGVNILVMARSFEYGKYLRKVIKSGELNKLLMRPINIIPYTYFTVVGENLTEYILAIVFIVFGIYIQPQTNPLNILQFMPILLGALLLSFYYNLLEGVLSFYIVSVTNITNTLRRIIEVLSGAIVPLYYFPTQLRELVELTPFPSIIYGPTVTLQGEGDFATDLLVAFSWIVVLHLLILFAWRNGLKNYEAVGM